MFETNPIFALLGRALDTAALRQAVHTTNIANADATVFHRLEVALDEPADLTQLGDTPDLEDEPRVVSTGDSVRLDQEMALMARDAVRYQALLNAFEKTAGLLDLACRDGRGG